MFLSILSHLRYGYNVKIAQIEEKIMAAGNLEIFTCIAQNIHTQTGKKFTLLQDCSGESSTYSPTMVPEQCRAMPFRHWSCCFWMVNNKKSASADNRICPTDAELI